MGCGALANARDEEGAAEGGPTGRESRVELRPECAARECAADTEDCDNGTQKRDRHLPHLAGLPLVLILKRVLP